MFNFQGIIIVFLIALVSGCDMSSSPDTYKSCVGGWEYYIGGNQMAPVIGNNGTFVRCNK
jgi:hypothetical protein